MNPVLSVIMAFSIWLSSSVIESTPICEQVKDFKSDINNGQCIYNVGEGLWMSKEDYDNRTSHDILRIRL